jgi:hypothetical protein
MGTLLLHDPWIQFYLLLLGAFGVAFIGGFLRNPPATRDGARTPADRRRRRLRPVGLRRVPASVCRSPARWRRRTRAWMRK